MNDPVDALVERARLAEIEFKELQLLASLRDHPGFRFLEGLLLTGRGARVDLCCRISSDEKTTTVARAELQIIDLVLGLMTAAERDLPACKGKAEYLREMAGSWQTQFGYSANPSSRTTQ